MVDVEERLREDRLIHRMRGGECARSKSEVILAGKLHQFRIACEYERGFRGANSCRYPDFTVNDPASGVTGIWEHLGMLMVPEHKRSWERTLARYAKTACCWALAGRTGTWSQARPPERGIDSRALEEQLRRVFSV